jgi:hypothetical protein
VTTQTEITQKNHRRAVRFFWSLLFGATIVSLVGNVTHAVLRYIPHVVIQIGAAAVPPVVLLAAVHGIALAVRAGASGTVYRWAVGAVAVIGVGAFTVSFLALRDLMLAIGYSTATAWIFPAIIDTAVAVSTMMLVALGDKPVRRARAVDTSVGARTLGAKPQVNGAVQSTKSQVKAAAGAESSPIGQRKTPAPVQPHPVPTVGNSVQPEVAQDDADLASDLIASRVTTQRIQTVIAVLAARRQGASINAAAKASGINYRTAKRIVEAAARHRKPELASAS